MEKPNGKLLFYGDEVPLAFPALYSDFLPLLREILGLDENFLSNIKLSYRDSDDDKIEIKSEDDYKIFMEEINKGKQMLMTIEVKEESNLDIKSCSSSILNYVEKKSGNINNVSEEIKKNSINLKEESDNNKNIKLDLNENINNDDNINNNDENSNQLIINNNINLENKDINIDNKKEEKVIQQKSEKVRNLDEQINNNKDKININNNINQIPQNNNINNVNNINNNLNQNVPQMSQNQNANQVNINKLSNKYLYMISFPFACSLCKVGPIYRIMYFCKECNLVLCSRCEQFEGERHYHPLYKVQNGSQLKYLNINNITTVDRIMDNLEGAYNSVLGFFGAGQNNNNESRVQQKQQQQQAQVPQLISVVQIARNMYDLRNVTDKQIEEALIKSKGNIDQAVFSLVPQ